MNSRDDQGKAKPTSDTVSQLEVPLPYDLDALQIVENWHELSLEEQLSKLDYAQCLGPRHIRILDDSLYVVSPLSPKEWQALQSPLDERVLRAIRSAYVHIPRKSLDVKANRQAAMARRKRTAEKAVKPDRQPGELMIAITQLLLPKKMYARYVEPYIADIQHEYAEALRNGNPILARWIKFRGYIFWIVPTAFAMWKRISPLWDWASK